MLPNGGGLRRVPAKVNFNLNNRQAHGATLTSDMDIVASQTDLLNEFAPSFFFAHYDI